jgi:anti-sigma regulatory factor (Ser/Thr protein kinase)
MADTIVLKPVAESIKAARDFVALVAGALGRDDYVPRVVASELVTNALRHAATGPDDVIIIRAYVRAGRLVIEAWDRSDDRPVVRDPDDTSETGRGLLLMSCLVERWGVRPLAEGGKVVFAELATASSHP